MNDKINFPDHLDLFQRAIRFFDFSYLPYCFLFVIIFSEKYFKHKKKVLLFFQLLPGFGLIHILMNIALTRSSAGFSNYIIPSICYLVSTILFFSNSSRLSKISKKTIRTGVWLGSISYGIYIVHYPLLYVFEKFSFFSGTVFFFLIRFILFISLTIAASFFLEKKLQQWIKRNVAKRV